MGSDANSREIVSELNCRTLSGSQRMGWCVRKAPTHLMSEVLRTRVKGNTVSSLDNVNY